MATHDTLTSLFTDIANAIRGKTKGTAKIIADNFPAAIAAIPEGSKVASGSLQLDGTSSRSTITITGIGFAPKKFFIILSDDFFVEGNSSVLAVYIDTDLGYAEGVSSVLYKPCYVPSYTISGDSITLGSHTQYQAPFREESYPYYWVAIG